MSTLLGGLFPALAAEFFPLHGTNSATHLTIVQGENLLTAFKPDAAAVEERFNLGFIIFTRGTNLADGWHKLVRTNDTVGIKVFSTPGPSPARGPPSFPPSSTACAMRACRRIK